MTCSPQLCRATERCISACLLPLCPAGRPLDWVKLTATAALGTRPSASQWLCRSAAHTAAATAAHSAWITRGVCSTPAGKPHADNVDHGHLHAKGVAAYMTEVVHLCTRAQSRCQLHLNSRTPDTCTPAMFVSYAPCSHISTHRAQVTAQQSG
jgi:hypothetical protein